MTLQHLYLSAVLNKPVTDASGQLLGRLWDLTVIPDEEFPVLSQLLLRRNGGTYSVASDRVVLFNSAAISVSVSVNELASHRETVGEIRVKRDILDKQVIDVEQAKLVRVNDLVLVCHKNALCLVFFDVGFRGLLRRMGYQRFWRMLQREIPWREINWEIVWHLEEKAARLTAAMAREQIGEIHPSVLAHIFPGYPDRASSRS